MGATAPSAAANEPPSHLYTMPQEPLAHFSGGPWMKDTLSHYILHNKDNTEMAILKLGAGDVDDALATKAVTFGPAPVAGFDVMTPYYDDDKMPYMLAHNQDEQKFVFYKVSAGASGVEEMGSCDADSKYDTVACFRHPEFDESLYFAYDYESGASEFGTINGDHSGLSKMGGFTFGGKFETLTLYFDKHKYPHLIVNSQYGWAFCKIKSREDLEASANGACWDLLLQKEDKPLTDVSHLFCWMYKKKAYFFAYSETSGDSVVFKLGKDCQTYQEIWKDNIGESRFNIICPLYIHKKTLFVCGNMQGAGGGQAYYYKIDGDGLELLKEEVWSNNAWTRFSSFQMPEEDWGDSSDIDSPSD